MTIALRTYGTDNNPPGNSSFCGIPVPIGVQDGDLIICAVAIPNTGITVTPPSDDWTQIVQTDRAVFTGITAFWRIALNEHDHWVFALSSNCNNVGATLVYANADQFEPVEAFATLLTTAAGAVHAVPGITASVDAEELVLFLAAGRADVVYTPSGGFAQVALKHQAPTELSGTTLSAQRRQVAVAGVVAPFTEAYTAALSARGAALVVLLRPSVGVLSVDDVRRRIVDALPGDVDLVYDLEPGGDYFKFFQVIASALKVFGFDLLDRLRLEIVPQFSQFKLPDWERIFGLETSSTARVGTIPQRQSQIVSAFRAAAGQGSSIPEIQAVLAPLLGYSNPANVAIMEVSRAWLTAAHTYANSGGSYVVGASSSVAQYLPPFLDAGIASQAGACLGITLTGVPASMSFKLDGPGGVSKTWTIPGSGAVVAQPYLLYWPELAGVRFAGGPWRLTATNSSGAGVTIDSWSVFIESIGRDERGRDGLGAVAYEWGVYADPAHLGENGTPANFTAVRDALSRLSQGHDNGHLIQSLTPYPDADTGIHAAVPDECVPTS